MICQMIALTSMLAINPCNVGELRASFKEPEQRCYIKMKNGKQHNVNMSCIDVQLKLNETPANQANEQEYMV